MNKREIAASILGSRLTRQIWLSSGATARSLRILAYHRILDHDPGSFPFDEEVISANVETFHRQMEFVSRNFNVITFRDLYRCEQEGRPWPERALIITFDDGYKDNRTHAFPVLKQFGLTATIFLTTGHIGRADLFWWDKIVYCLKHTSRKEVRLPEVAPVAFQLRSHAERAEAIQKVLYWIKQVPEETQQGFVEKLSRALDVEMPGSVAEDLHLSWDDVRQLHEAGIEFGSHTMTHPILSNITDARLREEIFQSKQAIEKNIGEEVIVFAYPAGRRARFSGAAQQIVAECGFKFAVAYEEGAITKESFDRYALPRIHVEKEQSLRLFRANLMFPNFMLKGYAPRALSHEMLVAEMPPASSIVGENQC